MLTVPPLPSAPALTGAAAGSAGVVAPSAGGAERKLASAQLAALGGAATGAGVAAAGPQPPPRRRRGRGRKAGRQRQGQ
jgi:hypothetical protein